MKKYDDNKDEEEVIREKNIINSIIKIDLEEI